MIIEHKTIEIFGKKVFEKAVVTPPFKNPNPLQNEACFLYVLEGQNSSFSEQEHIIVQQDEGVLMKCGNYIYEGAANTESGRFGLLAIHFYPEVLQKIFEKGVPDFIIKGRTNKAIVGMALVRANRLIKRFMEDILLYIESPELYDEELIALKLKEIIFLLLKTDSATAVREIIANFFSPRTFTLKEIVEAHIFSPLSISDLAQLCNCSLASFKREFRRIYKDSPASYIKKRRLEKAAQLLLISDETISSIAYDCQFDNVAHFSSSFKALYQLTPSEYRMSQFQ